MRAIITSTVLILSLSAPSLSAGENTEQTNARMQRLENEISLLKRENAALSEKLSDLQKLVTERLLPLAVSSNGTCQEKVEQLAKERDELKRLGLQDRHPDVVRVSSQIQTISVECKLSDTQ
ncbi:hypothetical protein [Kordiimonas sp.]|uniref:hypothetical protein n=1 Tax=Kordiimonas sp. TaxID=1970157 RepID=UPI003A8F9524